eukprot:gene16834-22319_t
MGKGGDQSQITSTRKISLEELSAHRTPDDAWLAYKGKVYDVSGWKDHPGGSVIFTHAGDDCTDIFAAFHPTTALKDLEKFNIGVLDESIIPPAFLANKLKPDEQKEFERSYRELRAKLLVMGYFNASPSYYVYKVTSNFCILGLSIACAVLSKSFLVNMLGAVMLGLFWQQSGWLAHDFLHHQVFRNRTYGDLMGLLIGGVCQGFSVQWWKSKHNSHHAVPNLHASSPSAADGDPDIDTMPLLAWTIKMAETARGNALGRFLIRYQSYLYFPLLLFARLAWAHQSWVFVFGGLGQHSVKAAHIDKKNMKYPILEKISLIIHYSWLLLVISKMSPVNGILYFFIAQLSCGIFLALVFGLGHNGMAVYPADQRPDFWKLQVSTTRNISSNWFVDWFCGGLHYQVDHHLFPSIPRHHLKKVHAIVESFCKEKGVTYHETGLLEGTVEVLSHLSKVSQEFIEHFPAM